MKPKPAFIHTQTYNAYYKHTFVSHVSHVSLHTYLPFDRRNSQVTVRTAVHRTSLTTVNLIAVLKPCCTCKMDCVTSTHIASTWLHNNFSAMIRRV